MWGPRTLNADDDDDYCNPIHSEINNQLGTKGIGCPEKT